MLNRDERSKIDASQFNLDLFLDECIQASNSLEEIHAAGSIHQGLCPSLFNKRNKTNTIEVIPCKYYFKDGNLIDQTGSIKTNDHSYTETRTRLELLNVISPEQTGRFHWAIDYRTDLYSLGAVFYKWAVSRYPFDADDEIGFFHGHIAKNPVPPHKINKDIPKCISRIILKMLRKSPEQRYQSATGILKDLRFCKNQIHTDSDISDFTPGRFDIPFFKIKNKLYGRSNELWKLSCKYHKILEGKHACAFISGHSGFGKTVLIETFFKKIIKQREQNIIPSCIYGKFDRLEQNRPYFAVIHALKQLAETIFSQSENTLAEWQQILGRALADEGRVIAQLVPEYESFRPVAKENTHSEMRTAKEKSLAGFVHFFRTVCSPEKPLIVAIDDLQWADKGALTLFQTLIDHQLPGLFLIGIFRHSEIPDDSFLNKMSLKFQIENLIKLSPLSPGKITELILDAINLNKKNVEKLAYLVHDKTKGNPLFVTEFLTSIYRDNLLFYDPGINSWHFDEYGIRSLGVTANVAGFLSIRTEKLSNREKELLSFAACTSSTFTASLLGHAMSVPKKEIKSAILFLESQNYFIQQDHEWRFSHDQIKENIYQSMSSDNRLKKHLLLGNAIMDRGFSKIEIFNILQHLNLCKTLIQNPDTRIKIAELNLQAGLAARQSIAFESACFYAESGISFLPENAFELFPKLCTDLHFLAGETGYYAENIGFAKHALEHVRIHSMNIADQLKAYDLIMANQILEGHIQGAWQTGLKALEQIKMKLPEKISLRTLAKEFLLTRWHLRGRPPELLENLPKMEDKKLLVIIQIYARLCEISYLVAHDYIFLLVLRILNMTLKHGVNELSGYAYALYGAVMCERLGRYNEGYRFGKLALKVHALPYMLKTKPRTLLVFGGMIQPWKQPLKKNFPFLLEAHKLGMQDGNDLLFAGFAMNQYLSQLMVTGLPLSKVKDAFEEQIDFFSTTNPLADNLIFNINYQAILAVMDLCDDPRILKGPFFDETVEFPIMLKNEDTSLRVIYMMKTIIAFLFYDWPLSIEMANAGLKQLNQSVGVLMWPYFAYFKALSILASYPEAGRIQKKTMLIEVKKLLRKLKKISKHSPENFSSMFLLVKAEFDGVRGNYQKTVYDYDHAIKAAADSGLVHLEAIANEWAAKCFLRKKNKTIASAYLIRAYNLFSSWEAHAKLKHLNMIYPDLLCWFNQSHSPPPKKVTSIINKPYEPGLISILKASQAISTEMNIGLLMARLMEIVIENAGASRGFLILLKNGKPIVEMATLANKSGYPTPLPIKLEKTKDLPNKVIHYVLRTKETLVLADALNIGMFATDPQIAYCKAKSILCLPMIHEGGITGALYLDNNQISHVFNEERVSVLRLVADILTNAWTRKMAQKELLQYQNKLRALSSKMSLTEENERRNIAQGLHDQIGQSLIVSKMKLQQLLSSCYSEDMINQINQMIELTNQTIDQTRSLTFDLSSPELYKLGLEAALDALCERKSRLYHLPIHFYDDGREKPLDEPSKILLYQVVRELLFNIVRHSKAEDASVSVARTENQIYINVKDNGIGFNVPDIETGNIVSEGFGLFSIRERMDHHNFGFTIKSSPGMGTQIKLRAPLLFS